MDPAVYVPAYLERLYVAAHPDLTPAARELVRGEIAAHPERYAPDDRARALVAYQRVHACLMRELDRMDDLPDDEFEERRGRLFERTRTDLAAIWRADPACTDAQLVDTQLADVPLDSCLNDLLKLEREARGRCEAGVAGFDADAPAFWGPAARAGRGAAELTAEEPQVIGWLHTVEALSQGCLMTARYRAAGTYARTVMRAEGYPNRAVGTLLLALARLEDEDGFFRAAHDAGEDASGSPWFLLGRTLLLYKLGRAKAARRALREFADRCEGGAFFLLNPTYHDPYLPVRPEPRDPWDLAHQAVWEADGIIVDTPDFTAWVESVDGIADASERFAARNGF